MHRVLVIGATGNIGREVVSQLPAAGAAVRALARNPDATRFGPDVQVVAGDLTIPETLDAALEGIEAVFVVWTAPQAAAASAFERIAVHARRIVFLSAPLKTPHPLFQQPNPVRATAEHIERLIEHCGLEWTFLRPGMLASNALVWWAPQIRAGEVVRWPYLEVSTAPIDPRDIATVAVRSLLEDGHSGAEYVLTGPRGLTHAEQIATIGDAIGQRIGVEELSPDEARRELLSDFPRPVIDMLMNAWAAAVGHPALVTNTFAEIAGKPPRTFFEWASDHAADFRA